MSNEHSEPILPIVKAEIGFPMHGGSFVILVDSAGIEWTFPATFKGIDKAKRMWVYDVGIQNSTHRQRVLVYTPFRPIAGTETATTELEALEPPPEPAKKPAKKASKKGKK